MSVISNNGFLSDPFPLSRGVRQGCPLSLLLYIINGEVINLNIELNHKIVGYPIPNQKETLKLSQCAGDTNFFVIKEESICRKGVLRNFTKVTDKHLCQGLVLLKLQAWHRFFPVDFTKFLRKPIFKEHHRWLLMGIGTGATINISKTTITPLAGAKVYNLDKNIKNTPIKDNTKILGVFFTTDLKITSTLNWNNCLLEIDTQLQLMSRRHSIGRKSDTFEPITSL